MARTIRMSCREVARATERMAERAQITGPSLSDPRIVEKIHVSLVYSTDRRVTAD